MDYIIIFGNPADGFEHVGPFKDGEEAVEYAHLYAIGLDWWVVLLQKPATQHED